MEGDVDSAFRSYEARFARKFGEIAVGAFLKFGNHMIQRLDRAAFETRLAEYFKWHRVCHESLNSGSTISDVLILEFEEACAWMGIDPPDILDLFSGEMGDPEKMLRETDRPPAP